MGGWLLCLFVVWLGLVGEGWGDQREKCPFPEGVEVPEEVVVGAIMVNDVVQPVRTGVVKLARDLINQDDCILPGITLRLVFGYDYASPINGLDEFLRIREEEPNLVGLIGPLYSSVSRSVALATPLFEIPSVSPTASASDLSDTKVYPFFSRVNPSDSYQGHFLGNLCKYYGWDRVATVSVSDPYGASIVESFTNQASTFGINVLSTSTFGFPSRYPSEDEYLSQMRSAIRKTKNGGARIILLACFSATAADYFSIALEEGLLGDPYTYLLSDAISVREIAEILEETRDEEVFEAFQRNSVGFLTLAPSGIGDSQIKEDWVDAWMNADPEEIYGAGEERFSSATTYVLARDALYTMSLGIDRLIRSGGDPLDGRALLEEIQARTDFEGLTGEVKLKPTGDRFAKYEILNTRNESFIVTAVGMGDENGLKMYSDPLTVFSDGTTNWPDAAERIYVSWQDAEAIAMVSLCSVGILLAVLALVLMMSHRKTPIMNYSSPRFICGMVLGSIVGFSNVFVWTGEPSSSSCQARPWLLTVNFVLIFGHLYAKAFRFLVVMRQRKQLLFRPIPDINLFMCVFFYFLIFAIPVVVWTAAFPLEPSRSDNNPDNDKVNIICDGDHAEVFFGLLLALGGISLVVGVIVAILNWEYHDFFSEATYIGYTMFTVCVTCCVVVPMLFLLEDTPNAFYVVLMLGIFLSNMAVVVFMYVPKVYVILTPGKNVVPIDESGALKTKKSSSIPFGERRPSLESKLTFPGKGNVSGLAVGPSLSEFHQGGDEGGDDSLN